MKAVEGWKKETLGRLAQLTMGQSPDSKHYSEEENGLPFLQGCAEFEARFPKHKMYCSQTKKLAHAGSILFSVRAPVGKINIADRAYIIGRGLAAIFGIDVDQSYLEHYLIFKEQNFQNASQGSTFEAINSAELNGWPIYYPTSKPEQAKIAEILSTVDRAIEQTEALIAKQQRIKTGLMQDLLTRGIDEHGNLRSEKTHHFKDSPLGRIPVEWEVKRLEELTTKIGDGIHTTPDYSVNTDYFFINGNNLNNGSIKLSEDTLCVDKNEYKKHYIYLDEQTILYSINGTIGNIAFYKNEKVILGKSAAYISCKKDINPMLIYFILQTEQVKDFYDNEMTGSTIKNLSLASIRKTPIKMPTGKVEQELLANKIDLSVKTKTNEESKLFKLRSLKTALMQDLLTGEKRVTPLLTEPQEAGA